MSAELVKHPKGFPTTGGHIVDPSYLPDGKREEYLAALREWCRDNPDRSTWPPWLRRYTKMREIERSQKTKRTRQ